MNENLNDVNVPSNCQFVQLNSKEGVLARSSRYWHHPNELTRLKFCLTKQPKARI
eukprot:Pgem_evm1s8848